MRVVIGDQGIVTYADGNGIEESLPITSTGTQTFTGDAHMSGSLDILATETFTNNGTSSFAGPVSLTSAANLVLGGRTDISGNVNILATKTFTNNGTSSFAGPVGLTSAADLVLGGRTDVSGNFNILATKILTNNGTSSFAGPVTFTSAARTAFSGSNEFSGMIHFSGNVYMTESVGFTNAGTSSLNGPSFFGSGAEARFSGQTHFTGTAGFLAVNIARSFNLASTNVTGVMPGKLNLMATSSLACDVSSPGYYRLDTGTAAMTATLAAPDAFPGGMWIIRGWGANAWYLTGTAAANVNDQSVFIGPVSGSTPNNLFSHGRSSGINILDASGSITLISDGDHYHVIALSGTAAMNPTV